MDGVQKRPETTNTEFDHITNAQEYRPTDRERKWDLLEGPKGRCGWGHHPYTLGKETRTKGQYGIKQGQDEVKLSSAIDQY